MKNKNKSVGVEKIKVAEGEGKRTKAVAVTGRGGLYVSHIVYTIGHYAVSNLFVFVVFPNITCNKGNKSSEADSFRTKK
jgi:hypothetical protein